MYSTFREEGFIESISEFRHLTIAQIRLFLRRLQEERKLEEANARARKRLGNQPSLKNG